MNETPMREKALADFKREIVATLTGHEELAVWAKAGEVADAVLRVLPSYTRRLLDSCTLHRERAETAEAGLDALRAAHHTPAVDDEHQGGNCVDIVMAQVANRYRAERALGEALADKDRVEASRRDWAAEAARLDVELEQLRRDTRPSLVDRDDHTQVCYGASGEPGECTQRTFHLAGCPNFRAGSVFPDGGAQ